MSARRIGFRPISPDDMPFLYDVYASTRYDVEGLGWSQEELTGFLQMQFNAQHQHYQQHFASAEFLIIALDGRQIGRLYIDRRADEIRIIDIALLKPYRNQGIGVSILRDILAEAEAADRPVRIHVERNNPALSLYERLGFIPTDDGPVYWLMEWTPRTRAEGRSDVGTH